MKFMLKLIALLIITLPVGAYRSESFTTDIIRDDFSYPWSLAFLPNGDALISEKTGDLYRISLNGEEKNQISNVPDVIVTGQGGLQDIILDRDFANNSILYLSYAVRLEDLNHLRVISAKLVDDRLTEINILLTTQPGKPNGHHYGARMAQLADGSLLVLHGDAFVYRDKAQSLDNHFGKILRISPTGEIPDDNPFLNINDALPEIYSYGHRNPQAILATPEGKVWSHEHGPKGGDELNLIMAGNNYGWPAITHGKDYSGAIISPFQSAENMAAPVIHWTPSIAPAGMAYYSGDVFPEWHGDLFIANLKERSLRRIKLDDETVVEQEILLQSRNERLRDVRMGPDGLLYILTDGNPGKLLRLSPND